MRRGSIFHTDRIIVIFIFLSISSVIFSQFALAEHREIEVTEAQERITIPSGKVQSIDFEFNNGKQLEIVYSIEVDGKLPIDIWFMNEDNYILLSNNAQFLFFIDGTAQQTSYARKVVTLTEHDTYKLVLSNPYNNQSVKVDLAYEERSPGDHSSDGSITEDFFYPLLIALIVLVVLVIVLVFKNRAFKNKANEESSKRPKDKVSKNPGQKKGKKAKKDPPRKGKPKKTKESQKSDDPGFCGFCGKPVDTPFCRNCGKEA